MKNKLLWRYAILTIIVTCPGITVRPLAQEPQTGQITGHVVDAVGAVIKGASVFVRRNTAVDNNVKLLTHTDVNGDFTLALPEGGYDVLVTSPGFAANVKTIPILARKTPKLQWKLKVLGCNFPGVNCDRFQ